MALGAISSQTKFMKNTLYTMAVLVCALVLSSCGDSHDKLAKDQITWMEDMTEIFNGVADGDLSSSQAADKIRSLGKEGEEFMARQEKLNQGTSKEELEKIRQKHSKEFQVAFKNYMKAVQKLTQSGRMTKELSDVVQNMKSTHSD